MIQEGAAEAEKALAKATLDELSDLPSDTKVYRSIGTPSLSSSDWPGVNFTSVLLSHGIVSLDRIPLLICTLFLSPSHRPHVSI